MTKAERNWRAVFFAAIVLPIVAVFLLSPHHPFYVFYPATPYDTYLNYRWYARAMALRVIGKAPSEVVALLGRPFAMYPEPTHTMWRYKPLPFYRLRSTGELVFVNGRVRNLGANDD